MSTIIEKIDRATKAIGSHRWYVPALFIACFGTVIVLYIWIPAPGVAVICLAIGAGVMTFREMTATHKLLWTIFLITMGGIEIRSIYKERNDNQIAASKDRDENQRTARTELARILEDNRVKSENIIKEDQYKTEAILKDNADKFSLQSKNFNLLSNKARSNLNLTNRNIKNITGSNSFAYIVPQNFGSNNNKIELSVFNAGKYTLNGVHVVIRRVTSFHSAEYSEYVGNMPAQYNTGLKIKILPSMKDVPYKMGDKNYFDAYTADITAQNGTISEIIEFRPTENGGWAQRFWAHWQNHCKPNRQNCNVGPKFNNPEDINGSKWSDEK